MRNRLRIVGLQFDVQVTRLLRQKKYVLIFIADAYLELYGHIIDFCDCLRRLGSFLLSWLLDRCEKIFEEVILGVI